MLHPKTREELQDMILNAIKDKGDDVDLNYIDVSGIDDMNCLFSKYYKDEAASLSKESVSLRKFCGDISEWNVSNVTDMRDMFHFSNFNGDISEWDVSSVKDMRYMFYKASSFNKPIGNWDVSNVTNMQSMFLDAKNFNGDISEWDVSSVKTMDEMFWGAQNFDQDLSNWKVDKAGYSTYTFKNCPIQDCHEPHFNEDNFILC